MLSQNSGWRLRLWIPPENSGLECRLRIYAENSGSDVRLRSEAEHVSSEFTPRARAQNSGWEFDLRMQAESSGWEFESRIQSLNSRLEVRLRTQAENSGWQCRLRIQAITASEMYRMDCNIEIQRIWSTTKRNAKLMWQTHCGPQFQAKIIFKNESKSNPKESKLPPKSSLEVSWEAKLKRVRFWMPRGHLKDFLWEAIWESKIVPKPLWKRFQHATDIEERFGMVFGCLGHQFLSVF